MVYIFWLKVFFPPKFKHVLFAELGKINEFYGKINEFYGKVNEFYGKINEFYGNIN